MSATDPRFERWVRLTDIYAKLCLRAMGTRPASRTRLRRIATELSAMTNMSVTPKSAHRA